VVNVAMLLVLDLVEAIHRDVPLVWIGGGRHGDGRGRGVEWN
jgi:hypothetical protein